MNNAWLLIDPVFSIAVTAAILIFLTVLFTWMEWKRQLPYLPLRMVALLLMMMSVAGFLFRPSLKTTMSEEIILLTPNYSTTQADSLMRLYPDMKVLQTADAKRFPGATIINRYNELSGKQDDISFIVGQGLPPEAMDLFTSPRYQFIPSPYPNGIVRISIPESILPNRRATISGIYNNPSEDLKLFLAGPGGKEDSVTFTKDGFQHFELSFLPKKPGQFVYTIASTGDLSGRLPIRVQQKKALNILFIMHHPSFETRYLKEFLGRSHQIVLRYQVSRNRYRHEYVNHEPRKVNRLSYELLSDFDLLIVDVHTLRQLHASETESLQSAISEGLGVLTLSSTAGSNEIVPFTFTPYARDTAHVFADRTKVVLPAWPLHIQPADGIIPVSKNKNRILSGYRYQGSGKIGFQLLQETYRLVLQGDSVAYGALWSTLLEKISRSEHGEFAIHQKSKFPLFPDRPLQVQIISSGQQPVLLLNGTKLPMKENISIDDLWSGKLWPSEPGWERLTATDSTVLDFYVSEPGEWESVAITNARDETLKAASSATVERERKTVFCAVSRWIFCLVFLLGAGFLWLAPKL